MHTLVQNNQLSHGLGRFALARVNRSGPRRRSNQGPSACEAKFVRFTECPFQFVYFTENFASAGNRTRAARVAGEHSTTEPPMLAVFKGSEQEGHPYSPVNLKSLHLCTVDYVAGQNSIRFLTPLHRPRRGGRVVKAMDC